MKNLRFLISIVLACLFAASCAPNPRRKLNADERVADMMWLATKIEANYAPLKYKEEIHAFNYEEKKDEYLKLAALDQENDTFYLLMKKFVAEFKDGHMRASFSKSPLPGRSKVAYLGFTGHREGDVFKVDKFLPTFKDSDRYPIKKDDEILEINDMSVKAAVETIIQPYRNVGNQEANYTALMQGLFSRDSMSLPLPGSDSAKLKIKRDSKTLVVEVPWVIEDSFKFSDRQREAAKAKAEVKGVDFDKEEAKALAIAQIAGAHPYVTESFIKNAVLDQGKTLDTDKILTDLSKLSPTSTFEIKSGVGLLQEVKLYELIGQRINAGDEEKTTIEKLKEERYTPDTIYPVATAKTYPAYVSIQEKDGKRHAIGYVRIDTFSPAAGEDEVVKEFKKTLEFFKDFGVSGVDKVVIDLINNGGGSLKLGMRLASALTSKKIKMPTMKYMLNDSWMDQYETASRENVNDAARVIVERAYMDMMANFEKGDRLSEEMSVESLYPFVMESNSDLTVLKKPFEFEYVLAINEMCASMCDIFSSIVKENKLAKFVGQQAMGAGGNVVQHYFAPNSGMLVNLTESLVVSSSGEYLENNGVKPDVEMNVSEASDEKYKDVLKKAFEMLID